MAEMLAIARNVGFGCRDFDKGVVGLWFEADTVLGPSALLCFTGEDALNAVAAACVGVVYVIVWGKVTNEPRFAAGVDSNNRPWCQTYDPANFPCPAYSAASSGYSYSPVTAGR